MRICNYTNILQRSLIKNRYHRAAQVFLLQIKILSHIVDLNCSWLRLVVVDVVLRRGVFYQRAAVNWETVMMRTITMNKESTKKCSLISEVSSARWTCCVTSKMAMSPGKKSPGFAAHCRCFSQSLGGPTCLTKYRHCRILLSRTYHRVISKFLSCAKFISQFLGFHRPEHPLMTPVVSQTLRTWYNVIEFTVNGSSVNDAH